jgi:hypothetical protein
MHKIDVKDIRLKLVYLSNRFDDGKQSGGRPDKKMYIILKKGMVSSK